MNHVIVNIIQHSASVKEFHLRRADGGQLADWLPGSHVMLRFVGADGIVFDKHYSLIGAPGQAQVYRIAVQREPNGKGGSRWLHDDMGVGSEVELNGPFNSFPLLAATAPLTASALPRTVLIAAGIGITPMISLALALHAQRRPFKLHYLAHSRERAVLQDELLTLPDDATAVHFSQESGRADLGQLLGAYGAGDTVYACGPVGMLQALAELATQLDWPAGAMHVESFGAAAHSADKTINLELSLSQMSITVQPGTSILDALIAADVFVSYDCKRGECGNCYTQVLDGDAVHRDVCLTPAMRAQGMCTCVSWATQGRLVLEL